VAAVSNRHAKIRNQKSFGKIIASSAGQISLKTNFPHDTPIPN
jgi:hypothetical protein